MYQWMIKGINIDNKHGKENLAYITYICYTHYKICLVISKSEIMFERIGWNFMPLCQVK